VDVGFEQTFDLHDRANHLRLADAVGKGSAICESSFTTAAVAREGPGSDSIVSLKTFQTVSCVIFDKVHQRSQLKL